METTVLDLGGGAFDGAASLLKYGPLGLSALLLILAVFVLQGGALSASRERLMRQFMWIGAGLAVFFGVMAFLPSTLQPTTHTVHLSVQPLGLSSFADVPRPRLTVDSEEYEPPLKIKVGREITAIVDVSGAMDYVQNLKQVTAKHTLMLANVVQDLSKIEPRLAQAQSWATNGCPGGSNGLPWANQSDVLTALSNARTVISGASQTLETIHLQE